MIYKEPYSELNPPYSWKGQLKNLIKHVLQRIFLEYPKYLQGKRI